MPDFPQYLLESLICFLLFAGYYRFLLKNSASFGFKRWYLRILPVAAMGLPLLSSYFTQEPFKTAEISKMAIENWLAVKIPSFSLSLETVFQAIFFAGFGIAAFRLTDRIWDIRHFLDHKNNRPNYAFGWQGNTTVCFSQLLFSWEHWSPEEKDAWADKWLPVHPVFGWEFLLVEIFYALNWWNPAAHWYRNQWREIYSSGIQQPSAQPSAAWKLAGTMFPLTVAVSYFIILPQKNSPTLLAGQWGNDQLKKVVFEHKKPPAGNYTFEWGQVIIPLTKYANPNGFKGHIEIELTDFQQVLKEEIKIYRGDQLLKPGTLSILYRSGSSDERAYINDINPAEVVLKDRRNQKIYNDKLGYGDELTLFGETEDIYLSSIQLRITDPKAGYEPVVQVPDIDHHEADFSFQITGRTGKRTLVKIDSDHPNAWRILELYKDSSRYEIVKIPGFRTNRRYVTENEALLSRFSAAEFDLTPGLPDVNYLPEYQDYQNLEVSLRWGTLEAAPSSGNYMLEEFTSASGETPVLWVGEKSFSLTAFEVIFAGKNSVPFSYRTDHLDYFSLRQALSRVQPESSVYFDRIVVQDEDGVLKLFPAAFAFHIGQSEKK